jgi:acetyl esterase/lipase
MYLQKMKRCIFLPFIILLAGVMNAAAQPGEMKLYYKAVPNSRPTANLESQETSGGILRIQKVSQPTLTIYLPPKQLATGAAVVICPGGGYRILAAEHEGHAVAKKFNEMGVAAFVLKYRLPDSASMLHKELGPLQDAQQALVLVRKYARKWNIDSKRVGIMGFSAGGHLAASAGTNPSVITGKKVPTDRKPNFMLLVYPVISFMDSVGHSGSRENLIGKNATEEQKQKYSNELQVNQLTPPTFLVHAKDDGGVSVKNSILFHEALKRHQIPTGIYLYEKGGHGFGLNNPTSDVKWMDKVGEWMREQGLFKSK